MAYPSDNAKPIAHRHWSSSLFPSESGPPISFGRRTRRRTQTLTLDRRQHLPHQSRRTQRIPLRCTPPLRLLFSSLPHLPLYRAPLPSLSSRLRRRLARTKWPPLRRSTPTPCRSWRHLRWRTPADRVRSIAPSLACHTPRRARSTSRKTSARSVWTRSTAVMLLGYCRVGMSSTRTSATSGC